MRRRWIARLRIIDAKTQSGTERTAQGLIDLLLCQQSQLPGFPCRLLHHHRIVGHGIHTRLHGRGDNDRYLRVAATLKHFYGNNTEVGRGWKNVSIDISSGSQVALMPIGCTKDVVGSGPPSLF